MNKIIICTSNNLLDEKKYVFNHIFSSILGLNWELNIIKTDRYFEITDPGFKKKIRIKNIFFEKISKKYLSKINLPKIPLKIFDSYQISKTIKLTNRYIPIIFGKNNFEVKNEVINLDVDIFGTIFFMITRYEEIVCHERDSHNRFSAYDSLSYKCNFLDRPIVDEYIELLWTLINKNYNDIIRKHKKYSFSVSCDVDSPYEDYVNSFKLFLRRISSDLIKGNFLELKRKILNFYNTKFNNFSFDSFDNFDWLMKINEKFNSNVKFYFLVKNYKNKYDSYYHIKEKRIKNLINNIVNRNHMICLHPSYSSYNDNSILEKEIKIFRDIKVKNKLNETRQHYLRWSHKTSEIQNKNNIDFDSTLGYADVSGFRCGTSHSFKMFDLVNKKQMNLVQIPLLVMEGTLFSNQYMNLNFDDAWKYVNKLYSYVKLYNGNFTLLWHNSDLVSKKKKSFYSKCVNKFYE